MKLIRNYLTVEEVGLIAMEMVNTKDDLAREILRIGLVAQAIVDFEDVTYETCDEYYDAVMASDIDIDKEVKNMNSIDRVVTAMIGSDRVIKDFVKEVEDTVTKSLKKIPKDLKDVNIENLLNQFKEVIDSGSRADNNN